MTSEIHDTRQIKSKDCPPRLESNIVLNVSKVRVLLNKNLRPFIRYAIRKMLDDKIGYVGIPKAKKDEIRAENGQNHEHENHKLREIPGQTKTTNTRHKHRRGPPSPHY